MSDMCIMSSKPVRGDWIPWNWMELKMVVIAVWV